MIDFNDNHLLSCYHFPLIDYNHIIIYAYYANNILCLSSDSKNVVRPLSTTSAATSA